MLERPPELTPALDVPRGSARPDRARDPVDGEPERDRPQQDDDRLVPGPHGDEESEQKHAVEEEARVRRRAEQLRRTVDHKCADHDPADTPEAAEDDDRVDRDQQSDVVVAGKRA